MQQNARMSKRVRKSLVVSIPQAVSTVATEVRLLQASLMMRVSIPQAVSTVATKKARAFRAYVRAVSIPQAVSTVATILGITVSTLKARMFQYRKR